MHGVAGGVPVGDDQPPLPVPAAPVLLEGGVAVHGEKRGGGIGIDVGRVGAEGPAEIQPQQRRGLLLVPGKLQLAEGHAQAFQLPAQKRRLSGLSGAVGALEYDQFSAHPMFPPPARHMHSGYFTTLRPICL